jgi:hypothetical protein
LVQGEGGSERRGRKWEEGRGKRIEERGKKREKGREKGEREDQEEGSEKKQTLACAHKFFLPPSHHGRAQRTLLRAVQLLVHEFPVFGILGILQELFAENYKFLEGTWAGFFFLVPKFPVFGTLGVLRIICRELQFFFFKRNLQLFNLSKEIVL